eukprot:6209303-Pleurochrysis_carterae.AAC.2
MATPIGRGRRRNRELWYSCQRAQKRHKSERNGFFMRARLLDVLSRFFLVVHAQADPRERRVNLTAPRPIAHAQHLRAEHFQPFEIETQGPGTTASLDKGSGVCVRAR